MVCASLVGACTTGARTPSGDRRAMAAGTTFIARVEAFEIASTTLATVARALDSALTATDSSQAQAQAAFDAARLAYKRAEVWIETYLLMAAEQINGAPIDRVEISVSPTTIDTAHGLQVIEAILFPVIDTSRLTDLAREAEHVRDYATRTLTFARSAVMLDEEVFDAARREIARIVTLGITGFDSPVRRASLSEAGGSLDGVRDILAPYDADLRRVAPGIASQLDSLFTLANAALAETTFEEFDRLAFIVGVANPLARAIAGARDALGVSIPSEPRMWRANAATLFESGAFSAAALCPQCSPDAAQARAALGERLFFDGALSGTGTRSCGSCHQPERAFTDGAVTSAALIPGARLRNAPTLLNAALQRALFTDMRTPFLEDQVAEVVANPAEMHGTFPATEARLRRDTNYVRAFTAAFPTAGDTAISAWTLQAALASYVRSLTRLDSPVDRALRGEPNAITPEERSGLNLFAGKAACATCHFLPLTNGTVPPLFIESEHEVIGVPVAPRWARARIDTDLGREGFTKAALHRHAFKTPTVRNAALTAPYMHNGVYRTLEEVVRFYDAGGGAGIGIELPNQTLPFDKLALSDAEQRALVAFMKALTDTSRTGRPTKRVIE